MCGIAGAFGTNNIKKFNILQTLDLMKNRRQIFQIIMKINFKRIMFIITF